MLLDKKTVHPVNEYVGLSKKRHGLTLSGKLRKVKPCLRVFSIIRLEYPACNTRRQFFHHFLDITSCIVDGELDDLAPGRGNAVQLYAVSCVCP